MPMYSWSCAKCKKELDIFRSFSEYDDRPQTDDPGYPDTKCDHKWEKILHRFHLTRGPDWKGKKGNW